MCILRLFTASASVLLLEGDCVASGMLSTELWALTVCVLEFCEASFEWPESWKWKIEVTKNMHRLVRTLAGERGGEKYPNSITPAVI